MSSLKLVKDLTVKFDPTNGRIAGRPFVQRHLSDLRGCFQDKRAFDRALADGDTLVYTVSAVEPASSDGDLHYGVGTIYPGCIGDEYFLTKGHLHTWRAAAEVYVGLSGRGVMLLEDETTGDGRMVALEPNSVVYVPGNTAHRTMNVGRDPLVYLGVYAAKAGHDYSTIAEKNFRHVVVKHEEKPRMLPREKL